MYVLEEAVKVKGQTQQETMSTEECIPPSHIFGSEEVLPLLEPLYPQNTDHKVRILILCKSLLALISDKPYINVKSEK